MQVFLLKDGGQINSLLAARAKNTQEISSLLVRLESLCKSEDEKQLLLGIKNARSPYVDSYQRALHLLIAEKKYEAAAAVMAEETTPALLKYHAAWDEFVGFEGDQLELAARQSSATQEQQTLIHRILGVFEEELRSVQGHSDPTSAGADWNTVLQRALDSAQPRFAVLPCPRSSLPHS
jgi:hypothetical protein